MVTNRSAPSATVVPILIYEDVGQASDWLCKAFGFKERLRAEWKGGVSHAQLSVAEGAIMLGHAGGPYRPPRDENVTAYVLVHVEDVRGHFEQAMKGGAQIVQTVTDMPFGERQYTARDPAGHWWTFSQHVADIAPETWARVAQATRDK